jgi:hypothetical protein
MHLSKYASRVTLLVRGDTLASTMSEYLITEVEAAENVDVRLNTCVVGGGGRGRLERLVLEHSASGTTETVAAAALRGRRHQVRVGQEDRLRCGGGRDRHPVGPRVPEVGARLAS